MYKMLCLYSSLCLLGFSNAFAQQKIDSSFHFYYYDQKLSMFEAMPSQKDCIVWLGDSITDGGEWSEMFPTKKTANRGISSDNTYGILNRLFEVKRLKPKKVFLLIGVNDIARNIPDSVIIKNFERIIDTFKLQMPTTTLYIQSILPTNNKFTNFKNHQNKTEHIIAINKSLRQLCKKHTITYINLHDTFTDKEGKLNEKYTNDGLHLTGQGYLQWKKVLTQNKYL